MSRNVLAKFIALLLAIAGARVYGQKSPGQNQSPGGSPQGSSAASLSGLSWPRGSWDADLGKPPFLDDPHTVLACYTLAYGNSASQPMVLKPATTYDERAAFGQSCQADKNGDLAVSEPHKALCEASFQQKKSELSWSLTKMQASVREAQAKNQAAINLLQSAQKAAAEAQKAVVDTANATAAQKAVAQKAAADAQRAVADAQKVAADAERKSDEQNDAVNKGHNAVENATNEKYTTIKWSNCANLDAEHPVRMGQKLIIGIDAEHIDLSRIKILNLNLTNQQGNPINPTPVRPSFSASASSPTNLGPGGPYYLTWPNQIPGDVIPTVNVNAVYTPPIPGDHWAPGTFYAAGSVVTYSKGNGHYYVATVGGVSADKQQDEPAFPASPVAQVTDGNALWLDTGNTAPGGNNPQVLLWQKNGQYAPRQVIFDPYNGHYYTNLATGSLSCSSATNCVQVGAAPTDPFSIPSPTTPIPTTVTDGTIVWGPPSCAPPQPIVAWTAFTLYNQCDRVTASNGSIYEATQTGVSGPVPTQPYFPISETLRTVSETTSPAVPKLLIKWEDVGTTPPQSVSGGQPADMTVSLLNLQYAQSHSLSYYNLASGVFYSTVHSRTFGFQPSGCSSASTCTAVQTGGSANIDPVLLFSIYPWPWDSEAHCPHGWCLGHFKSNPPGLSFGLSLASPANSFYAGGSLEIIRNLQLVVAANFNKRAQLPPGTVTQPTSAINSGTPITVQKFSTGGAFGLTLNISGFIQSLFGGGGGAGGGGGNKSGGGGGGSQAGGTSSGSSQ